MYFQKIPKKKPIPPTPAEIEAAKKLIVGDAEEALRKSGDSEGNLVLDTLTELDLQLFEKGKIPNMWALQRANHQKYSFFDEKCSSIKVNPRNV